MYNIKIFTQFGTILKFDFPTMGKALTHWRQYSNASSCMIKTPSGEIKHYYNEKREVK